jgi:hypothetical protein
MFRRLSFVATVFLFSALNADVVVSDDSFSCQISKQLETSIWNDTPLDSDTYNNSSKSSIEILAEQDGSDFDSLIINTITSLVNEINPEMAASIYLGLIKKTFDAAFAPSNLEILASSKNKEELKENLKTFFQKLLESLSSKDSNLKTSVCFATFTDETVKEITNSMSTCMQDYFIKLNELTEPEVEIQTTTDTQATTDTQTVTDTQTQEESDPQIDTDIQNKINSINALLSELSKNILSSIASVFENHGYKIDRQALGL